MNDKEREILMRLCTRYYADALSARRRADRYRNKRYANARGHYLGFAMGMEHARYLLDLALRDLTRVDTVTVTGDAKIRLSEIKV